MIVNVCGTHSNVAQKRTIALLADRVINVILYDYKRLPQTHTTENRILSSITPLQTNEFEKTKDQF